MLFWVLRGETKNQTILALPNLFTLGIHSPERPHKNSKWDLYSFAGTYSPNHSLVCRMVLLWVGGGGWFLVSVSFILTERTRQKIKQTLIGSEKVGLRSFIVL